jgi:lipopolysaccharide export system permease protein
VRAFPSILARYLAASYARAAAACVLGVVALVLVVDFADRAYSFGGERWFANVVRLYANLSAELAYQVAPAALLLAAGIAVSGLRQQGEFTAMLALGRSERRLVGTILASCAVAAVGTMALNEWVVVDASRRAEVIKAEKFRKSGDFAAYFGQKQWFRGRSDDPDFNRLYHVRGEGAEGFVGVTIYELGPGFHLLRRIDASRLEPTPDGSWIARDATVSTFEASQRTGVQQEAELPLALPETAEDFRLRAGRPSQLRLLDLWDQIQARRRLGLPEAEFRFELHNRLAYPLSAVPGALFAVRLALRKNRKGHLTIALAEGLLVSLVLWALLVIFRAVGLSGGLPPAVAAWAPVVLVAGLGIFAEWLQGWLWRRPVPAPEARSGETTGPAASAV